MELCEHTKKSYSNLIFVRLVTRQLHTTNYGRPHNQQRAFNLSILRPVNCILTPRRKDGTTTSKEELKGHPQAVRKQVPNHDVVGMIRLQCRQEKNKQQLCAGPEQFGGRLVNDGYCCHEDVPQ